MVISLAQKKKKNPDMNCQNELQFFFCEIASIRFGLIAFIGNPVWKGIK